MSFISYAQNFEDVMLWRALKHLEGGFYIDVGAYDPDIDSVTKAFYEKGWRGINVEPTPQCFERLVKARPLDINLQIALGAEPGEITFYEIPDTGLSTAEKKFAQRHEAERGYQSLELRVKVDTLTRICEKFRSGPIHFLKIDVEGAEKAVIQGVDFGKIRPWIIVIEATLPNSKQFAYSDWEPLVLEADYEYVYFDGLNRYYVANEHKNLRAAFNAPPNIFDDFVRSARVESERRALEAEAKLEKVEQQASRDVDRVLQAEFRAEQAETLAAQAEAKAKQALEQAAQAKAEAHLAQQRANRADTQAQEAEMKAQEFEAVLQAVFNSHSWRLMAPLRWLVNTLRPQNGKGNSNASLGTSFKKMSNVKISNGTEHTQAITETKEETELSPRAREIYSQLKAAVEKNQ